MEKLIKQYKKECDITSKLAQIIWKVGHIGICFLAIYCRILFNTEWYFLILFIFFPILYILCEYINLCKIKNKLKCDKIIIFRQKHKKTTYQEFNEFQTNWITNYCKRNRLNNISKLQIIRNELKNRRESKIKYINPTIIGALTLIVWQIIAEEILNYYSLYLSIVSVISLTIIISFIIGEFLKQIEFNNLFSRYSGYERLEDLILYRILKINK